ncbi:MAG TPA: TonB family protein [Steroidobacteraceae bacterium]|nr:TonB family protein [Steroidobacteraceae bacterium]
MDGSPGTLMLSSLLAAVPAAAQRIENAKAVRIAGAQLQGFRLLRGDSPAQHYPAAARQRALDASVVVDLLLNESGRVLEAQVVGAADDDAGFGLAALDTAKTFEFENPLKRWVLLSVTIEFAP